MHLKHADIPSDDTNRLTRRGESIYYVGSMLFISGIILLGLGFSLVMIFQIHYGSEPTQVLWTASSVGLGLTLVAIGMNLMIKQGKTGYYIIGTGVVTSSTSIILFISNYINNWYYPTISYILGLYLTGFLLLIGNAFGHVTLWLIENKPETVEERKKPINMYTDEEIQKDIEEATRKSIEATANKLQFEFDTTEAYRLGKSSSKTQGIIVRIKDDMNEIKTLQETINPGVTDEWGSIGVDKASMQLTETLTQQEMKQGRFGSLWERILKRVGFH